MKPQNRSRKARNAINRAYHRSQRFADNCLWTNDFDDERADDVTYEEYIDYLKWEEEWYFEQNVYFYEMINDIIESGIDAVKEYFNVPDNWQDLVKIELEQRRKNQLDRFKEAAGLG